MRRFPIAALSAGVAVAALGLTGCSTTSSTSSTDSSNYATDATFTYAIGADPGALQPQGTAAGNTRQLLAMAYDTMVMLDDDGKPQPYLAASWTTTANSVTYSLRDRITCADGTPLTPTMVAANYSYVTDPDNASPLLGVFVAPGITATADDSAGTVTLTDTDPVPFIVETTGQLFIGCDTAINDPASLDQATDGTGMFTLTDADPGQSYTFTRRDDYAWGPDDTTGDSDGTPASVVVQVVADETTKANLLLNGQANAALVLGADQSRLTAAGLKSYGPPNLDGELFFNQQNGILDDPKVRLALVKGMDVEALRQILKGEGQGRRGFSPRPKH